MTRTPTARYFVSNEMKVRAKDLYSVGGLVKREDHFQTFGELRLWALGFLLLLFFTLRRRWSVLLASFI